jgi:YD repeat-containing protein
MKPKHKPLLVLVGILLILSMLAAQPRSQMLMHHMFSKIGFMYFVAMHHLHYKTYPMTNNNKRLSPLTTTYTTYYYTGQPFSIATCEFYYPGRPCANGFVSGSVTFADLPSNFTGAVGATGSPYVASFSLNSSNVGTHALNYPSDPSLVTQSTFFFSSGVLTTWALGAYTSLAYYWPYYSFSTSNDGLDPPGDGGQEVISGGTIITFGVNKNTPGTWSLTPPPPPNLAKMLGPSCDVPGGVGCGHPITLSNGNVFEQSDDYATVGQNPLSFTRYYNSLSASNAYAAALGSNWRHSFDRYLHIVSSSSVLAERATGQEVSFSSSGSWSPDTDMDYSLTNSGTTWTLTDPDDTIETYSQSGTEATLSTIKLRNGYTQTMHYTSGKLSSVTDTYGRHLGISYSSIGLLSGVTTPDAPTFAYGYVSFGSAGHLLSTVTYNTSPATHQTYAYSNTSFPTALTGITDENGHSYASWTYDSTGRGATSQLASGVNFTSVSYFDDTGYRNVTGPLGIQETYKFTNLQGVPKVSEIDRASNGTVAAANEKFAYDSNGYTQSVNDWNGNQTYYTNNSHGLPTSIVFASGSTVSHTTSITYDTTWARLAHVITTPGLTTTLNYDSSGNLQRVSMQTRRPPAFPIRPTARRAPGPTLIRAAASSHPRACRARTFMQRPPTATAAAF